MTDTRIRSPAITSVAVTMTRQRLTCSRRPSRRRGVCGGHSATRPTVRLLRGCTGSLATSCGNRSDGSAWKTAPVSGSAFSNTPVGPTLPEESWPDGADELLDAPPADQRQAVELRVVEDMSYDRVARRLAITPETAVPPMMPNRAAQSTLRCAEWTRAARKPGTCSDSTNGARETRSPDLLGAIQALSQLRLAYLRDFWTFGAHPRRVTGEIDLQAFCRGLGKKLDLLPKPLRLKPSLPGQARSGLGLKLGICDDVLLFDSCNWPPRRDWVVSHGVGSPP
jgi:DNA-directed RNA polymerase specialized sigma24 family protein